MILNFRVDYFGCCYPNGYDESNDISVSALMVEEIQSVRDKITEQMSNYFLEDLCKSVSGCIVAGLVQQLWEEGN